MQEATSEGMKNYHPHPVTVPVPDLETSATRPAHPAPTAPSAIPNVSTAHQHHSCGQMTTTPISPQAQAQAQAQALAQCQAHLTPLKIQTLSTSTIWSS
jgi:hypothetical protein